MCRDSISLRCHKRQHCRPCSILQRCSVRWSQYSQCCSCRSSAMFYTLFTILFDKVPRNYAIFIFVSFCTDGPRTRGNKKFSIQLFMFRVHRPAVKLHAFYGGFDIFTWTCVSARPECGVEAEMFILVEQF